MAGVLQQVPIYYRAAIDRMLALKIDKTKIGVANGVAGLDASGKVPVSNLPTTGGSGTAGVTSIIYGGTSHTGDITLTAAAIGADAAGAATSAASSAQSAAISTAETYADRYAGSAAGTAGRPLAATDPSVTNARIPSQTLIRAPKIITAAGASLILDPPSTADSWDIKLSVSSCAVTLPTNVKDATDNTKAAAFDIVTWFRQGSDIGGRDFTITNPAASISYLGGTKPSLSGQPINGLVPIVWSTLDGGAHYVGSGPSTSSGSTGGTGTVNPLNRVAKTAAYTAALGDNISADTAPSGTFNITLPAASGGKGRIVVGWDGGTVAPQVVLTGSDKFNVSSTTALVPSVVGRRYQLESDGTSIWTVTAGYIPSSELVLQTSAIAKGDILYASAPGVWSVLAPPSQASVLNIDNAGNLSWQLPSSGGGSSAIVPGQVLSNVDYGVTASQTDATTTVTTLSDVAAAAVTATWSGVTATSFDCTFTVPPSGAVTIRAYVYVKGSGSGVGIKLATYDVTNGALIPATTITVLNGTAQQRAVYEKTITGLTAGANLTYRLQWGLAGAGTGTMSTGGTSGPVRFSVAAA